MALVHNLQSGRGFVLFDDQPYLWYSPIWYVLAAWVTTPLRMHWFAASFSGLAAPLLAIYLHRITRGDAKAAFSGGLLMAGWGPAVWYTCQPGSEGMAMFLLTAALVTSVVSGSSLGGGLAGVLFGTTVVLRPPFVFDALLFESLSSWRRRFAFAAGAGLPLAAQWWRNHRIITSSPFVFSWDGMATPSESYGPVSTLFVHMHPSVGEALTSLHGAMRAQPDWLFRNADLRWEMVVFIAVAILCVVTCRRPGVLLAGAATIGGVFLLDDTGTMNFSRAWAGFFPVMFIAIALVVSRLESHGPSRRWIGSGVLLALVLTGLPELRRDDAIPLEAATPPEDRLSQSRYMVASGFYHPDALAWRFPDRRFVGMPLDPGKFADFAAHFAAYETILWHPVGAQVQAALFAHLSQSRQYEIVERWRNEAGYDYLVMRRRPEPP